MRVGTKVGTGVAIAEGGVLTTKILPSISAAVNCVVQPVSRSVVASNNTLVFFMAPPISAIFRWVDQKLVNTHPFYGGHLRRHPTRFSFSIAFLCL